MRSTRSEAAVSGISDNQVLRRCSASAIWGVVSVRIVKRIHETTLGLYIIINFEFLMAQSGVNPLRFNVSMNQ